MFVLQRLLPPNAVTFTRRNILFTSRLQQPVGGTDCILHKSCDWFIFQWQKCWCQHSQKQISSVPISFPNANRFSAVVCRSTWTSQWDHCVIFIYSAFRVFICVCVSVIFLWGILPWLGMRLKHFGARGTQPKTPADWQRQRKEQSAKPRLQISGVLEHWDDNKRSFWRCHIIIKIFRGGDKERRWDKITQSDPVTWESPSVLCRLCRDREVTASACVRACSSVCVCLCTPIHYSLSISCGEAA